MVMPHDASFLAKCEQFLLHPTVRALSLAQRVDFLEKKGLSPEEITACLKNIERQNGLSRLLLGGAATAASASATAEASDTGIVTSVASSLWTIVKGYGVATAATLVLAYGYVRLRQRMIARLMLKQRQAAAKRRQTRQLSVVEAMRVVADQRTQYEQVLTRVKNRTTRLQLLTSTQATEETTAMTAQQKQRERRVQELKEKVLTLKQAVLAKYKGELRTQVHNEIAETKRHAEVTTTVIAHPDVFTVDESREENPVLPLTVS